jgi:hypothetical protein
MKIVTSSLRMPGISANSPSSINWRGCARVMSHTEIPILWPGFSSVRNGGFPMGAAMALLKVSAGFATAGTGTGSITVVRSPGRSTVKPSLP